MFTQVTQPPSRIASVLLTAGPSSALLFGNDRRGIVYLDRLWFATGGAATAGAVQLWVGLNIVAELNLDLAMPPLDLGGMLVTAGPDTAPQLQTTIRTIGAAPPLRVSAIYH